MTLILPVTITHFTAKELLMGKDVPEELFHNIISTAMILNDLREWYGSPIFVNSTYRSPEYNKAVGGAKNSLHLKFNAIDFTIEKKKDLKVLYAKLDEWDKNREQYHWPNMGLGLYERQYFIHCDTRGKFGMRRSRWTG